jgi:DNA-nicking Smr family endonuclease
MSPLEPLDRRTRQRLARGTFEIDGRLDLHGRTQNEAHGALLRFLRRAQADGARFVLVITGKGAGAGDDRRERGVLKRQVPLWLKLPEFRAYVSGFEEAHIGHGGAGALYVRLRRAASAK